MAKYNVDIPEDMLSVIRNCRNGLGATGVISGLIGPGIDVPVIVGVWVGMTIDLADKAGHSMSEQTAKKIATAVCTGAGALLAGTKIASTALGWLAATFTFGLSLVASAGANAALNASFTTAYGKAVSRLFLQTSEITDAEMAVKVLIALIGVDLGFSTPYDNLLS